MPREVRFDPPPVIPEPELCWLLACAFGPTNSAPIPMGGLDAARTVELAKRLDLAARVGARNALVHLEQAAGVEAARRLRDAAFAAAAAGMVIERVAAEIAALAAEVGTPVVFLKGAALLLSRRPLEGSRRMGDIDALVARRSAPTVQEHLLARGCSVLEVPESDHQLQLLTHPKGIGVEVHTCVPGVRFDARSSAVIEELTEAPLVVALQEMPGRAAIPGDAVMLAHLLVHGLGQHGLAPESYPLTRMIGDAQDLCPDRARWDGLLTTATPWIAHDVSQGEAEAARDLALGLAAGESPQELLEGDTARSRLLRHAIAGLLQPGYAQAIRLRSLASPLVARVGETGWPKRVFHAIWLTQAQVDIVYGRPRTAAGYWGWRLWRPFDIALRAVRYGRAWLRHRLQHVRPGQGSQDR